MLIEKIQLWDDNDSVTLHTYILNNSMEFQKDQLRPAVVICPGGGYLGTSDREAEPVALKFASLGYHTFVLRYTTYYQEWVKDFQNPPEPNKNSAYPQPLFDLAKAMLIIRENASKWYVDPEKIAICGFSAGGHLSASLAVHWNSSLLNEKFHADNELFKPNAVILGYPLLDYQVMKEKLETEAAEFEKGFFQISNKAVFGVPNPSDEQLSEASPVNYVTTQTPPSFIWHTADDPLVYAENSLRFATQLAKHKVPYELHIFESGVHGLSLCDETTASNPSHLNADCKIWVELASNWLKKHLR
ncbi:alpha/beta hydrolase [Neobacillus sp. Marseille-QA0830]